jgi:hypothetical protein
MNSKYVIIFVTAIALVCVSCSDNESDYSLNPFDSTKIKGSGIMTTQARDIPDFNELIINAAGEINITFGSPRSVTVIVDDNIMSYIETVHQSNKLEIIIEDGIDPVDYDLVVNVVVPSLSELTLGGAGTITGTNTLQTDHVDLTLDGVGSIDLSVDVTSLNTNFTGPGNITLSGSSVNHECEMSTVGRLKAFDLTTSKTLIDLRGIGKAEVHATDSLNVDITGLGKVYYQGYPVISGDNKGPNNVIDSN